MSENKKPDGINEYSTYFEYVKVKTGRDPRAISTAECLALGIIEKEEFGVKRTFDIVIAQRGIFNVYNCETIDAKVYIASFAEGENSVEDLIDEERPLFIYGDSNAVNNLINDIKRNNENIKTHILSDKDKSYKKKFVFPSLVQDIKVNVFCNEGIELKKFVNPKPEKWISIPLKPEVLATEFVDGFSWQEILPNEEPDYCVGDTGIKNILLNLEFDGYQNIFMSVRDSSTKIRKRLFLHNAHPDIQNNRSPFKMPYNAPQHVQNKKDSDKTPRKVNLQEYSSYNNRPTAICGLKQRPLSVTIGDVKVDLLGSRNDIDKIVDPEKLENKKKEIENALNYRRCLTDTNAWIWADIDENEKVSLRYEKMLWTLTRVIGENDGKHVVHGMVVDEIDNIAIRNNVDEKKQRAAQLAKKLRTSIFTTCNSKQNGYKNMWFEIMHIGSISQLLNNTNNFNKTDSCLIDCSVDYYRHHYSVLIVTNDTDMNGRAYGVKDTIKYNERLDPNSPIKFHVCTCEQLYYLLQQYDWIVEALEKNMGIKTKPKGRVVCTLY